MPYASEEDLPANVKGLSTHKRKVWRSAFNAAHSQYHGSEEKAFATAWAAANKIKDWSEESRAAALEARRAAAKGKGNGKEDKPGSAALRAKVMKLREEYAHELRENGENHPRTVAVERKMLKAEREYGVVHRGERGGGALKWSATGYHDMIKNVGDLKRAIKMFHDKPVEKAAITKRAIELGCTDLLPQNWNGSIDWLTARRAQTIRDAWLLTKDIRPCPMCDGAGKDEGGFKCERCDGEGYIAGAMDAGPKRKPDEDDDDLDDARSNPDDDPDGDDDEDDDDQDMEDAARHRWHLRDTAQLGDAKPRKTKDGYLVVDARICRTGIQLYTGDEVEMPDMGIVRVYRPASEVFDKRTMKSLANKPITLDHPPDMVDASNWREYSVGQIGEDVVRDGDCVRVPMLLMDKRAIDAYEKDGIRELSVGYSTELKFVPGTTPSGETYDAVQTAIRGNHLAVVPAARGGSRLRIGDDHHQKEGANDMAVKILIDGQSIVFDEELAAKHVQTFLGKLQTQIADANKKIADQAAEKEQEEEKKTRAEKDSAAKDGEIAVLKKQIDDFKKDFGTLVADRIELLMKANAAMGGKSTFNFDTDPAVIQRAVVAAKYGEEFAKTLDAAQMSGAFKAVTADIKAQASGVDRLADGLGMLQFGGGNGNDPRALKDAAYRQHVQDLSNAWRTPQAGNQQSR
jgi:uncharacterized protein